MAWPAETLVHWPSDGQRKGSPKVFIEYCKSDVKVLLMYVKVVAAGVTVSVCCCIKRLCETHNAIISLFKGVYPSFDLTSLTNTNSIRSTDSFSPGRSEK